MKSVHQFLQARLLLGCEISIRAEALHDDQRTFLRNGLCSQHALEGIQCLTWRRSHSLSFARNGSIYGLMGVGLFPNDFNCCNHHAASCVQDLHRSARLSPTQQRLAAEPAGQVEVGYDYHQAYEEHHADEVHDGLALRRDTLAANPLYHHEYEAAAVEGG
jgi:hypothetical protein